MQHETDRAVQAERAARRQQIALETLRYPFDQWTGKCNKSVKRGRCNAIGDHLRPSAESDLCYFERGLANRPRELPNRYPSAAQFRNITSGKSRPQAQQLDECFCTVVAYSASNHKLMGGLYAPHG